MADKEAGNAVIAELWSADYVEQRVKARSSFSAPVHDFAEGVNFGEIWTRPGLDRKMRCVVTLSALMAMNRTHQAAGYINAALNSGVTVEELREILLHLAIYTGLPASIEAFKLAEQILRERGLLE